MGDIVLQGVDSSRPDLSHIAKKSWRQRLAGLFRKSRYAQAVLPRNSVHLPLVDGFPVDGSANSRKHFGHAGASANGLNQFCMTVSHAGSVRISFGLVNGEVSDDANFVRLQTDGMANERSSFALECGERLRKTRTALGFRVLRRFAENTGAREDSLQKWELGGILVPPWYAVRLKELFGVSLDWIYAGDASKMHYDLTTKLLQPDE